MKESDLGLITADAIANCIKMQALQSSVNLLVGKINTLNVA